MEFLNYKNIKAKLKKRGLVPAKKPSQEETPNQFLLTSLERHLEDPKVYPGLHHLANTGGQTNSNNAGQVGTLLNAARAFSQAKYDTTPPEDHIKLVVWMYNEALLICDRSFIRPIRLEMAKYYESLAMYEQASECFKQSMSISKCVSNLILAKRYKSALDELKNCPSHLMTTKDHTSMFLLELLLNEDPEELSENSLQHLLHVSRTATNRGILPNDDHLFDLTGLLESLFTIHKDKKSLESQVDSKENKEQVDWSTEDRIRNLIVEKLSAFLDPTQIQLLELMAMGGVDLNCLELEDQQEPSTPSCEIDEQQEIPEESELVITTTSE